MKVLLLGNYELDRQESMQRFATLLMQQLPAHGIEVELVRPEPRWGCVFKNGLSKWMGYVDKFVLFPSVLRQRITEGRAAHAGPLLVHICDHSNSIYTWYLRSVPHVVTCHDLLAVRSALGEVPQNPTRWSGRQLQRFILNGLNRARRVTCDSEATLRDVLRLSEVSPARADVTEIALNYPYSPMPPSEAERKISVLLKKARASLGALVLSPHPFPFLLHVGGNQWYKNRLGVLQIYSELLAMCENAPRLVMAGKPFPPEMNRFVAANGIHEKVISIQDCDNEELRALYSRAELLLFPSLEEGFGWPIIEAQACGCRVVTTNKPPMTSVGGDAAALLDLSDLRAAAAQVKRVLSEDETQKRTRVEAGLENATRFSTAKMMEKYVRIYRELAASREAA